MYVNMHTYMICMWIYVLYVYNMYIICISYICLYICMYVKLISRS